MLQSIVFFFTISVLIAACSGDQPSSDNPVKANHEVKVDSAAETTPEEPEPVEEKPSPEYLHYLVGKYEPQEDDRFVEIDVKYASREGLLLRKEVYKAFKKMREAAMKDGLSLKIVSATRNFNYQKRIWEAKWNGKRLVNGMNLSTEVSDPAERAKLILKYSSMPGTSRHHWGTDIDLNKLSNSYFEGGYGKKVYEWLMENAADFGFCQTYTEKGKLRPHGYEEEKWHWSYQPIANQLLSDYLEYIDYSAISGFAGSDQAAKLQVVDKYVAGINPDCK